MSGAVKAAMTQLPAGAPPGDDLEMIAVDQQTTGYSSANITFDIPAAAEAGDMLLVAITSMEGSSPPSPPAGWTDLWSEGFEGQTYSGYQSYNGTDTQTGVFNKGGTTAIGGILWVIRNWTDVDLDTWTDNYDAAMRPFGDVTVPAQGGGCFLWFGRASGNSNVGIPTGYTEDMRETPESNYLEPVWGAHRLGLPGGLHTPGLASNNGNTDTHMIAIAIGKG